MSLSKWSRPDIVAVALPSYDNPLSTKNAVSCVFPSSRSKRASINSTYRRVEPFTVRCTIIHNSSSPDVVDGIIERLSTKAIPWSVVASLVVSLETTVNGLTPNLVVSVTVTTLAAGLATVKSACKLIAV